MSHSIRMSASLGLPILLVLLLSLVFGGRPSVIAAQKMHQVPSDIATSPVVIDASAHLVTRPHSAGVDIAPYETRESSGQQEGDIFLPRISNTTVTGTRDARRGWAIGIIDGENSAIVHTVNGGQTWIAQGDPSLLAGFSPGDVSAVDDHTAWVALPGSPGKRGGRILKTTDGGTHWIEQSYPESVTGGIKGIKGLSRSEAWAASLDGQILHTIDGGNTWALIPHPKNPITQVNRIDAIGSNVWIADSAVGGAIVHTRDGGSTWRSEYLPDGDYPLTLQAYDPSVIWGSGTAGHLNPTFYRTTNGGEDWLRIETVGGLDHMDDICAADENTAWGVVNGDAETGRIFRIHPSSSGALQADNVTPPGLSGLSPAGVTCVDSLTAWVVADRCLVNDQDEVLGQIVFTNDGGQSWGFQDAPIDIKYWKISFVGARR